MIVQRLFVRFMLTVFVVASIFFFLRIPVYLSSLYSEKSINVLVLPNIFDASNIKAFEKESGIKVYITYFDTYEELMVKMRAGGGDYDLIMGVDYLVEPLRDEELVKPLDKSKMDFVDRLYPAVKNL
jgi:spermidine/putrescine transport system substrate-binding protein